MSKKKVRSIMKTCASKEAWMDFYNDEDNFMLNSKARGSGLSS